MPSPPKLVSRWLPGPEELARGGGPAGGGPVRGGCLLGLLVVALGLVAARGFTSGGYFLREGFAVPVLAIAGLTLLLLKPILERWSGKPEGGLRAVAVGLVLLLSSAGIFALALAVLDHPLIHRTYCAQWLCDAQRGGDRARGTWIYLAVCALGAALGLTIVGHLAAQALRWSPARSLGVWLFRVGAAALILAASALLLASVATRARRPNPSLTAYVESLPELARLPPAWPTDKRARGLPWRETTAEEGEGCAIARFGDVWAVLCGTRLGLVGPRESPRAFAEGTRRYAVFAPLDRGMILRRDVAHGLLIIEAERALPPLDVSPGTLGERVVFRELDLEPTQLDLSDIRELTGPPVEWIAAAVAGLILAVAAMAGGLGVVDTRDERAVELALANRYLLAMAAVALTAAPLMAAALRGLVRPW